MNPTSLESAAREWGRKVFSTARRENRRLSTYDRGTGQILEWCLKNPELKSRLLRFVDVLPSLSEPRDVLGHIRDYFPLAEARLPLFVRLGALAATAVPFVSRGTARAVET